MGIELKFYDQKLLSQAIPTSSTSAGGEADPSATVMMNTVVQGDGESQRDGRKITMRSILIDGVVTTAPQVSVATADIGTTIFIALIMDTQCNGATFNSEDVYTNPGGSGVTAANPLRNLQFVKRFKVLATRRFSIQNPNITNDTGSTGGVIQNGQVRTFKIFKKLHRQVSYSATTETVANIVDNCLHLLAFSSNAALVPTISYNSRLRFVG